MSSPWRIRHSGSPQSIEVPSANRIVAGLRDGDWEATDEVLAPGEQDWKAIEDHVAFAEICEDLEPVKPEPPDETRLDMNPLIDVSLVLLIFFILTTTYASLRRSIELPHAPSEKSKSQQPKKQDDIKDRVFKLKCWVEDNETKIKIEEQLVSEAELEKELKNVVNLTGKREMFLDIDPDTPWGIEAKIYDAARGADIRQIYWPRNRK